MTHNHRGNQIGKGSIDDPSLWRARIGWAVSAAVATTVVATYWPVLSAQAMFLDDGQYVVTNHLVQQPSWASVGRFFTEVLEPSTVRGYYQPLSMVSLLVDYAVGGRPDDLTAFHRTSLFLHVINAVLVAQLVFLLTRHAASALVCGLLFGLHPAAVESVVWVSQRKTLLAATFALIALVSHVWRARARKGGGGWYALSLVAYALALLSKPSALPVPVLMLILDIWPLRRSLRRALIEKIPFVALAAVSTVITFVSQDRTAFTVTPAEASLANVLMVICHNVVFYLRIFFWPAGLSPYYPFPELLSPSQPAVLLGVIGTILLVAALVFFFRRAAALTAGMMFFLLAIFPALGVVGFANVIAANRFAYLPFVGLIITVGYFVKGGIAADRKQSARAPLPIAAIALISVVVLGVFAAQTRARLAPWTDTLTLSASLVRRYPDEAVLQTNLADALAESGRSSEAVEHYQRAIELDPDYAEAHCNLAVEMIANQRYAGAITHATRALAVEPNFVKARYNLATALLLSGDAATARLQLSKVVEQAPEMAQAHSNLGAACFELGEFETAVHHFRRAIQIDPEYVEAYFNLACTLDVLNRVDEAQEAYRTVLRLDPRHQGAQAAIRDHATTPARP